MTTPRKATPGGCSRWDFEKDAPRRLGFSLGNEWSDHATEKLNYLYLAPSKLRQCAVGPELVTDSNFEEITLHCRVRRDGAVIYDSGPLLSGQRHMCHSLANCEDHHFKYPPTPAPGRRAPALLRHQQAEPRFTRLEIRRRRRSGD